MSDSGAARIFAVVLAAGQSRRFGATKQLVPINGEPMVHRAATMARKVCGENSLLVVGNDWKKVAAAADGQCQFMLLNDGYSDGMGSSIACAAKALAASADALLLILADQPLICEEHFNAMLAAWSGADDDIVVTAFAGAQGPPVLMPRSTFPDLSELGGDVGAKTLLNSDKYNVSTIWCDAAGVDVDRPEDLIDLNQAAGGRAPRNAHN
jgi:molybdenum cofactor cytidylyltransferase